MKFKIWKLFGEIFIFLLVGLIIIVSNFFLYFLKTNNYFFPNSVFRLFEHEIGRKNFSLERENFFSPYFENFFSLFNFFSVLICWKKYWYFFEKDWKPTIIFFLTIDFKNYNFYYICITIHLRKSMNWLSHYVAANQYKTDKFL